MKYRDYYAVLGIERDATADDVKKAYRKLAHRYHPDVSSDPAGEEKFKEVAEAYATLKDVDKRAAYDQLGPHRPGDDLQPPRGWQQHFSEASSGGEARFDDVDLADLFAAFGGRRRRTQRAPQSGRDFDVTTVVTLEQVYDGAEIELDLEIPEAGPDGLPHRVAKTYRIRIPKGAEDGQRLRLAGKGGASPNGGPPGDLYVALALQTHPLYRVIGRDLQLDLPLAPWEAVLGASVEVPTPGGRVAMDIPAGTTAGRKLRLARRGLPDAKGAHGDLYAVVRIEVPATPDADERASYEALRAASSTRSRAGFERFGGQGGQT